MKRFIKLNFGIKKVESSENNAIFQIEPLVQGFGATLGNSLRRVLLSSLLGAAIYAYKIEGIHQEFQNLEGIEENIVKIGLNLREIIFRVDQNIFDKENEKILLIIDVNGKKIVKAKDIQLPSGVEIINQEKVICNIVNERHLKIELFLIQGRGFSSFEENKILTKDQIGMLTVNSNFSCVQNVSINVKEIKIGEQDVLESLILNVKTNGAYSPQNCVIKAAQILIAHFEYFVKLSGEEIKPFVFDKVKPRKNDFEKIEILQLDFSERTNNALASENIKWLSQLKKMRKSQLLKIKNLGQKSLKEITDKLENEYKFKLEA